MAVDVTSTRSQNHEPEAAHEIVGSEQTTCCVVGGGPAGVILSYMLARKGVPVTLLEAHKDFDRDFRGDSLHPSTMEILDELGLADRVLQLPHQKISRMTAVTPAGAVQVADISQLKSRFPYIVMMPQAAFLDFMVNEARQFSNFQVEMSANVGGMIEEEGVVRGVRFRGADGWHEVRALLTVGADGRFSKLRQLAGFEPIKTSSPMDVLWFRLPRQPEDAHGGMGRFGGGRILVELERQEDWQLGLVIPKGSYQKLHAAGIEALRQAIVELAPEFAGRTALLTDWKQVSLLSVESNRLPRWYRPGLLLIGDAAHTMSPAGGNGINYAIHDAVAAANLLTKPLKSGAVNVEHLAAVQRRRELPIRIIQGVVGTFQNSVISYAFDAQRPFQPPIFMRLPMLRGLVARVMGYGIRPEHVKDQA
jgi:2-polyprenyl-6-methoxyphenol hydroxylase-like FAD-dependent oxidoreductase